jgi:hypothetical protein
MAITAGASVNENLILSKARDRAEAVLERMGYQLLAVEIDGGVKQARMEVRRHDGYTLTLDVRHGTGTITRERLRRETIATGRRGNRFLADRLAMQFLGRTRVPGDAQTALRAFADMINDNATAARAINARHAIEMLVSGED